MPEGLAATEVGRGIAEHAEEAGHAGAAGRHARILSIVEAALLSLVTLTAAWSAYAAAKWGTESSIQLAAASADRTQANRATYAALDQRNFDASTFNAWFAAYVAGNRRAMHVAELRFRPSFEVAFRAWLATKPGSAHSPPGPTYMPQYKQPELARATALDAQASVHFTAGSKAGQHSDDYVRATIFLASVLFLVGISTHFPLTGVRYGLVGLGCVLLLAALVQLVELPGPPA